MRPRRGWGAQVFRSVKPSDLVSRKDFAQRFGGCQIFGGSVLFVRGRLSELLGMIGLDGDIPNHDNTVHTRADECSGQGAVGVAGSLFQQMHTADSLRMPKFTSEKGTSLQVVDSNGFVRARDTKEERRTLALHFRSRRQGAHNDRVA